MVLRASLVAVVVSLPLSLACGAGGQEPTVASDPVARGEYLVTVAGCHDCHTPMKMGANGLEPDMTRMLSGHPASIGPLPAPAIQGDPWVIAGSGTMTAWAGPWGISYAANLTPDDETGFGVWDEAMFVEAMRGGKHLGGGRPILPPMPWPNVAKMTDEDLKAIYAYLKTIPPIKNQVPEPTIAEPPAPAQ